MKSTLLLASLALFLGGSLAQAQYKAPSQYFRKDSPGVNRPGAPATPGNPSTPANPTRPAAPEKPKFKDVTVNAQFYFLTDTNRAFPWTKVTAATAKNAQGLTRSINVETPVQK